MPSRRHALEAPHLEVPYLEAPCLEAPHLLEIAPGLEAPCLEVSYIKVLYLEALEESCLAVPGGAALRVATP